MSAPIPTSEPGSLIAGDTAKWLKTLGDYPATAGWVLSYILINATSKITFSASASGADHLVNVAAATTASWAAGSYSWRASVALAGEVYTVGSGTITVEPAFGVGVSTLDDRSFAAKALANIEAYLVDPNNLSAARYSIAGREIQKIAMVDLLKARDKYKAEVALETAASDAGRGLPDRRRIYVRFGG